MTARSALALAWALAALNLLLLAHAEKRLARDLGAVTPAAAPLDERKARETEALAATFAERWGIPAGEVPTLARRARQLAQSKARLGDRAGRSRRLVTIEDVARLQIADLAGDESAGDDFVARVESLVRKGAPAKAPPLVSR